MLAAIRREHQRLKDGLHEPRFDDVRRGNRRYLAVGSGSGERGERRRRVCARLDDRSDAVAFWLEEFGFDGGHVWDLG